VGRQAVWQFTVVTGATGVLLGAVAGHLAPVAQVYPRVAPGWGHAHGAATLLAAVLLVVLAGLLALRRHAFPAVPGHGQVRLALRCAVLALAGAGLYDVVLRHHPGLRMSWPAVLLLTVTVAAVPLLASSPAPAPGDRAQRRRVGELVDHAGSDTLAPFALRRDKSYVFSPDGRAAIGYRVLLGVAVAGADPVGDPDSYAAAVDRFAAVCARHGWHAAAIAARGDLVPLWRRHGMHAIGIGDEVVLDTAAFGLGTRRMRNVRQAVRRTHNCGVTTEVLREGALRPELRAELAGISTRWLDGVPERGFSMNLDGVLRGVHPECVLVVARDASGRAVGFQRYAPCRGGTALSLDTMRRWRSGPNGLNERMIVDLVEHARQHGVERISLNFAAFRGLLAAGEERRGPERVGYRLVHLLDPLIRVESLYLFNAKFRPDCVPRSVVFSSWSALPAAVDLARGGDHHRLLLLIRVGQHDLGAVHVGLDRPHRALDHQPVPVS